MLARLLDSERTPLRRQGGDARSDGDSGLKVLQVSSSGMEFFLNQVDILTELGIDCDAVYTGDFRDGGHIHGGDRIHGELLSSIAGHNPIYYAIRGSMLYPQILKSSLLEEYDLIHINSGVVAPLGLAQPQRPVVMTFWGDDVLGDRIAGLQPRLTKLCATQSDHVIVRSQEMAEALPCEASILPSGVDMSLFRPMDRAEAREAVGWDSNERHVIFPYHESNEKKRHSVAVRTVEKANESVDETVRLQTVDDADFDEMPVYYNAADLLLVPSLREGSPNTVKEAMACNLPVVSTDVGDARTRLVPVTNSHVCSTDAELVDAVVSVLETGARSDGREHVEEVSLERMGERLIDIYESLLDEQ
ncbi:glycosyltransferase family 4 protein [Halomicroarcula sp. F28]|uniref:glycosyltransferase family 4 protein n=1 Tax=Haloarcula salinisoli TaxID=2487746 RepID=UPI001C72DA4D|nr:glycosyltransferase family 4 protein [Halomicroarcula salinisoli]MBX0288344.1 glycosyltransferase family 4 protein [Halomicroarcula salinisoli]